MSIAAPALYDAVFDAARTGLAAPMKSLPPWLFYDAAGSALFEQITTLPEYYLTRTERAIFERIAVSLPGRFDAAVTVAELGAGSAAKTGLLLRAFAVAQSELLYQPIDISPSAMQSAASSIERTIGGVRVVPQLANYITEPYTIGRPAQQHVLALYIGSSIGNFSPQEAVSILANLRAQLQPGDALLLGVDLAPGAHKPVERLLAAYDDARGVTAAFNRNILARLNRELGTDFDLDSFAHRARWNGPCSRIEMHLESLCAQTVHLPAEDGPLRIEFLPGETIHTENSRKFTAASVDELLAAAGFVRETIFTDDAEIFASVLARVV
jgi:dimethylhistidine N-methyltransferase